MPLETLIIRPDQMGAVLRARRTERGLTQKQVGQKVGLLPKTVSALESDPARSSLESLFKLLSALDMEVLLQPKSAGNFDTTKSDW